ncbi:FAD-dependent oxidoreductase [Nonomuraea sp. SBT364]|uniref:FAD-dependent oxidoreductase n=1 Tax=Nonomuraea sp. SBT364 TaxID=1580530 RepID=UPI00066BF5FF|nr:FAD-dependent monooxygenase [Nonomuraea sp. SBT364]
MRVVVAGGGVAGAACAVALARIGAEVSVHEAYEDPAGTVGSFVSLPVNGLRALDALGCLAAVRRAGFAVARQRMWSGRGKRLGDVARGRRPDDPLLSVTLMRADLVTALRGRAVRAGARIVTGHRLTGADDPATAGADLVVGADGIWSATRAALDPARPVYAGLYSVSGTIPRTPAYTNLYGTGTGTGAGGAGGGAREEGEASFNMVFARNGAFIHLPAPGGQVWWSAQIASAEPPADLARVDVAGAATLFPEPAVTAVLGGGGAGARVDSATPLHVLAPLARRQDGRTVLVGDAAHPVGAGQGASMALEDAVLLARALGSGRDVPAALAVFDEVRRGRAGKLARSASANRDAKTAGRVAARLREVFMPFFFDRFYERATGWLYDYDLSGELAVARP